MRTFQKWLCLGFLKKRNPITPPASPTPLTLALALALSLSLSLTPTPNPNATPTSNPNTIPHYKKSFLAMPRKKTFGTRVQVQRNNSRFVKSCKAKSLSCKEMQSTVVDSASKCSANIRNKSLLLLRAADRCLRLNCHCQEDINWGVDNSWCYFCHSNDKAL